MARASTGGVVGWAALAPRAQLPVARSRRIPHVDDQPVWSIWCIRVRPEHRGRGISHAMLAGAVSGGLPRAVMRKQLAPR